MKTNVHAIPCEIESLLPKEVSEAIQKLPKKSLGGLHEIRLRAQRAASVTINKKNILLQDADEQPIVLTAKQIQEVFENMCENSLYKYENEIRQGYITVKGGHRIGFCGSMVSSGKDQGLVRNISSINMRISHQVKNAAADVFSALYDGSRVLSCLIVSEPCGGKTTILTDIVKRLSSEKIRSCVVDERGEICASFEGVPQKPVGDFCDVMDGYSKGEGMMIALRTLSPQVIICDEIGSSKDVEAMLEAMNAGVPVIATAHAISVEELLSRPQMRHLIDNGGVDIIILLRGAKQPGKIDQVVEVNGFDQNCWSSNDYM